MSETVYAVQYTINNRSGAYPRTFNSKSDAVVYARLLSNLNEEQNVVTNVRVYECKEIAYK